MMRRTLALLALCATGAAAQTELRPADPGRAMAERLAQAADADGDGAISFPEVARLAETAFASIDADGDGGLVVAEMLDWDYGLADIAAFRDRDETFRATVNVMFDLFDRDDDGRVDAAEHAETAAWSARYADRDGDGVLSTGEYLSGFIFNIAMRNALVR